MKEQNELLQRAANEIRQLRSQNQLMAARLDMFDSLMLLFRTEPNFERNGMGEDIVWQIEKTIASNS